MHRWRGFPSPTETTGVLRLRRALRRLQAKRGIQPRRANALIAEDLRRMMAVCGDDLIAVRDRALIAFAFSSGGRRRSEVAGATVEALERHPDGHTTLSCWRVPRPTDSACGCLTIPSPLREWPPKH